MFAARSTALGPDVSQIHRPPIQFGLSPNLGIAQLAPCEVSIHDRQFVNVGRELDDATSDDVALVREFAERFRRDLWPGERMPELFHDRALLTREQTHERACMPREALVAPGRDAMGVASSTRL